MPDATYDEYDAIPLSPSARLSSYVKTTIVVNGQPVYLGSEMTDEVLEGEDFDEFSARISSAVVAHLGAQIAEAKSQLERKQK